MEYTVKTPVEGYNGISASLFFVNGVSQTTDENLVNWFKKHGYIVTEPEKPKTTIKKKKEDNTNV